jgi:hypothetical protein
LEVVGLLLAEWIWRRRDGAKMAGRARYHRPATPHAS